MRATVRDGQQEVAAGNMNPSAMFNGAGNYTLHKAVTFARRRYTHT